VSKAGDLSITGNVGTSSVATVSTGLNISTFASNSNNACSGLLGAPGNCYAELIYPTSATIALTSLTVALDPRNSNPWGITLWVASVPNNTDPGDCIANASSWGNIQQFDLQPGTTTTLSPQSPIILGPADASHWVCLYVSGANDLGYANNTTDDSDVYVSATGYVVSGSYYPGYHQTTGANTAHNTGHSSGRTVNSGPRPSTPAH
jgi:hypothetical protein